MKKIILFFGLCFSFSLHSLWAFSVGKVEEPITINDQIWQQVKYTNKSAAYLALFPGNPKSGISNDYVFSTSKLNHTIYEVHTNMNEQYQPPENPEDFLQEVSDAFGEKGTILLVDAEDSGAKYCAEVKYFSENKLVRIFVTKHHVYYAIVEGEDLSLAPLFFTYIELK